MGCACVKSPDGSADQLNRNLSDNAARALGSKPGSPSGSDGIGSPLTLSNTLSSSPDLSEDARQARLRKEKDIAKAQKKREKVLERRAKEREQREKKLKEELEKLQEKERKKQERDRKLAQKAAAGRKDETKSLAEVSKALSTPRASSPKEPRKGGLLSPSRVTPLTIDHVPSSPTSDVAVPLSLKEREREPKTIPPANLPTLQVAELTGTDDVSPADFDDRTAPLSSRRSPGPVSKTYSQSTPAVRRPPPLQLGTGGSEPGLKRLSNGESVEMEVEVLCATLEDGDEIEVGAQSGEMFNPPAHRDRRKSDQPGQSEKKHKGARKSGRSTAEKLAEPGKDKSAARRSGGSGPISSGPKLDSHVSDSDEEPRPQGKQSPSLYPSSKLDVIQHEEEEEHESPNGNKQTNPARHSANSSKHLRVTMGVNSPGLTPGSRKEGAHASSPPLVPASFALPPNIIASPPANGHFNDFSARSNGEEQPDNVLNKRLQPLKLARLPAMEAKAEMSKAFGGWNTVRGPLPSVANSRPQTGSNSARPDKKSRVQKPVLMGDTPLHSTAAITLPDTGDELAGTSKAERRALEEKGVYPRSNGDIPASPLSQRRASVDADEVAAALKQISRELEELLPGAPTARGTVVRKPAPVPVKKAAAVPAARASGKCFPVQITGLQSKKSHCPHLRCTDCDFAVTIVDGMAWAPGVDYLFFRNAAPDLDKLKRRLMSDPEARSYCCQCMWSTMRGTASQQLVAGSEPRWACSG